VGILRRFLYSSVFALLATLSLPAQSAVDHADPELRSYLKQAIANASQFKDRFDAEVWLVSMSQPMSRYVKDHEERLSLLQSIHRAASAAELQPELVLAVIQVESAFDQYAISRVGAQGLMQVMPFWKKEIGRPDDNLTDVETNLRYGCYILKFYIQKEKGHLARALARYNGSLGKTWYSERVLVALDRNWSHGRM
jgi:soluble lytic murein transglycosylase-like protein